MRTIVTHTHTHTQTTKTIGEIADLPIIGNYGQMLTNLLETLEEWTKAQDSGYERGLSSFSESIRY